MHYESRSDFRVIEENSLQNHDHSWLLNAALYPINKALDKHKQTNKTTGK